jgi:peptidoglycan/LPS O-acetylase OafA/YrhL
VDSKIKPHLGGRIHSLDGIRGIAALVVLVHHTALLFPSLAATYYDKTPAETGGTVWWLSHTPLHLLWEGDSAVYIFFILSGVVLTLPFMEKPFRAKVFFPQRLLRLYLPIWAAVLFAAITVILVPRTGDIGNAWLDARVENVTALVLSLDLTLVLGPGGVATPLWSLQWEILFSLALPIYLWLAIKWRGHLETKLGISILVICSSAFIGGTLGSVLKYLPMFMMGVVMITERDSLTGWAIAISRRKGYWPAAFFLGVLLLAARWYVVPLTTSEHLHNLTIGLMVIGAGMIVFCAVYWPPLTSKLERPTAQWLGKISFSLYLIHEPILVTLAYMAGPANRPWAATAGFAISLLAAPLFFRWVERPSHNLAKAVSARSRRIRRCRDIQTDKAARTYTELDLSDGA